MNFRTKLALLFFTLFFSNCTQVSENYYTYENEDSFEYKVDQFADLAILRYQVPGWDELTLKEKQLVYYLTQAGLSGRDIFWDQKYRYNLTIRKALENIYVQFKGNKSSEDWNAFEIYLKRIWFSNGIHHHYSNYKIKPDFSKEYLIDLINQTNTSLEKDALEIIFNDKDMKMVDKTKGVDNVLNSAVNFYAPEITFDEVTQFYNSKIQPDPTKPLSFGLNSKLVKENGKIMELVYKADGLYGNAIKEIIKWLEMAVNVAENEPQAEALKILINFYKTGDLKIWDDYCVAWTKATEGNIDYINGFIEVYNDPIGLRGSYETIVQINDFDMSRKMSVLSENVQWFEDNSSIMDEHKKENVKGVSYKTVNVAGEAGDASPSTPIGVNLPNANWIRANVGSKSVSLGNIKKAYNNSGSSGRLKEFVHDSEEYDLEVKYGALADDLHTALHEVIGHASGQLMPGVGTPSETLKTYRSTIEEGRADLLALYYIYHPKIQELGLVDDWQAVGKASYDGYIRNGMMTQLIRLNLGDDVEQAHMRNRKWVSEWVFEMGKKDNVIEKISKNGKTYFNINSYSKLRELFGKLLRETQRIKSEGDYVAAEKLVESYGVKVDQDIHAEILKRNEKFKGAPYAGFVNPELIPVFDDKNVLIDIEVKYVKTFEHQMLEYSREFGFLD